MDPLTLHLGPDGALQEPPPGLGEHEPRGATSWVHDESTGGVTNYSGSHSALWRIQPNYHWQAINDLTSASFMTPPLPEMLTLAGGASADLWIRSSAPDVDLEVTLTEVRPDGQEMYIQSGWLRASQRALDEITSTPLVPFHTHLDEDAAPLPADEFSLVRIEITPVHPDRAARLAPAPHRRRSGRGPLVVDVRCAAERRKRRQRGGTQRHAPVTPRSATGQRSRGPTALATLSVLGAQPVAFVVRGNFGAAEGPASSASMSVLPTTPPDFDDVGTEHLFYGAIRWMRFVDGTFRPSVPSTRGASAAFLFRYPQLPS